jgi:hypothetical protein
MIKRLERLKNTVNRYMADLRPKNLDFFLVMPCYLQYVPVK